MFSTRTCVAIPLEMLARKLYHLGQTDPNARMTQRCAQGGFVKLTSTLLSRNVNVKVFTETP